MKFSSQFSETGNQSLSVLTFTPTVDDDGKYLTCRAENPFIADSALEDKWRLVVHCKCFVIWYIMYVSIEIGYTLNNLDSSININKIHSGLYSPAQEIMVII